MKKPMTYEMLVEECRRLKAKAQESEVRLFLFLVVVERDHSQTWSEAGCETFDVFLLSNHLPKPDRYHAFKLGLEKVGPEEALRHGVAVTIAQGRAPAPEFEAELRTRAQAFVEVEGFSPGEETVREWRNQLTSPSELPEHATVRKLSAVQRLKAENDKLRVQLAEAQAKIKLLEKELRKKVPHRTEAVAP